MNFCKIVSVKIGDFGKNSLLNFESIFAVIIITTFRA